jgi:hypothetical protein
MAYNDVMLGEHRVAEVTSSLGVGRDVICAYLVKYMHCL